MKNILISILCLFSLLACQKSDNLPPSNPSTHYTAVDSNVVYLDSNSRIIKIISSTIDNRMKWTSRYFYSDTIITVTTLDSNLVSYSIKYKIGSNGFAVSAIYNSRTYYYSYDSSCYLKSIAINNDSMIFFQNDGDLYRASCTPFYSYYHYDTLNIIDVCYLNHEYFLNYYNGIVGKINKHLIKAIGVYFGLGTYSSTCFSYSMFLNGLIKEKYVTKKNGNNNIVYDVEYYLTKFRYVFNYTP